MAETTITGLPNASTPLSGSERVPMDQSGATVDASTQDIANLAPGTDLSYDPATRQLSSSTGGDVTLPLATASAAGLLADLDKAKLDQLEPGVLYVAVKNDSGGMISKGTPLYAKGTVGDTDVLLVAPSDSADPAKVPTIGLAVQTLAANAEGSCIMFGELTGINTSSFEVKDELFVAAGGGLTKVRPTTGYVQAIAVVTRKNSTTGSVLAWVAGEIPKVPAAADAAPQPLGVAAVGSSVDYAREDHVHAMPSAAAVGADPAGTASSAVAAHVAAADPHPGYLLESDPAVTNARPPLAHKSTHATGGSDALTPSDIGAEVAGAAASAVSSHVAAADPHPGYALESSLAAVATSGSYADLSGKPSIPSPADAAPQPPGTAAIGTSTDYAREDHVHAPPPLVTSTTAGLVPEFGTATGKVFTDGGWATPSAGAPGGSNGQLQFNNNGAFGGVSTLTTDGSGNLTFSGRWINSRNGAANEPASALTGTWFTGGTATTTKPQFLIEPAGTTSTAWSTNGTGLGVNAPSGFTGSLLDLQVGGVSALRVVGSSGSIEFRNGTGQLGAPDGASLAFRFGSVYSVGFGINRLGLSASSSLGWSSGNFAYGGQDLSLFRDDADTLAQRRGTIAQTFRLYNTFTSATDFERLSVRWTSNEAILDCEAGGAGGTLRGLKIGSASTSLLGFYGATPAVQPTAVANATDAATVITQLNALLSRLRTIGIIAT